MKAIVTCRSWRRDCYTECTVFHIYCYHIYFFIPKDQKKKISVCSNCLNSYQYFSSKLKVFSIHQICHHHCKESGKVASIALLALEIDAPSPGWDSQPLHGDQKCPHRPHSSVVTSAKRTFKDSRHLVYISNLGFPILCTLGDQEYDSVQELLNIQTSWGNSHFSFNELKEVSLWEDPPRKAYNMYRFPAEVPWSLLFQDCL